MKKYLFLSLCLFLIMACGKNSSKNDTKDTVNNADSVIVENVAPVVIDTLTAGDIKMKKELLYDKYTLQDEYYYRKSKNDSVLRVFQWDVMKERLAFLENLQKEPSSWAVLQNYKNRNGESPLVKTFVRNEYTRISDDFGVERYQSVALFSPEDTLQAERYGRDGSLAKVYLSEQDSLSDFIPVETVYPKGKWMVNKKYVKVMGDTVCFDHVVFVDITNQNITTMMKEGEEWIIRSMNPATTGVHKPPYAHETPVGMFVIQEKKRKMVYLKDGSSETGGFAPYASRFTNGAYIHGIPSVHPSTTEIEYSSSLGTIPRSHMCVRNASSHARFVYENMPVMQSVIFVID